MPVHGGDQTFRLLYGIFHQRFSLRDLQKSIEKPIKLGLVGRARGIELLRGILAQTGPWPPDYDEAEKLKSEAAEALVSIPIERDRWEADLKEVHAIIVLVEEADVRQSLLDEVNTHLQERARQRKEARDRDDPAPPELQPYVVCCHGPFGPEAEAEAAQLERDLKLRPFFRIEQLDETSVRAMADAWVAELSSVALRIGRRLPFFRRAVSRQLTARVSRQNLTIAAASAIPSNIPIVGPIAGTLAAAGEFIVLTANQLKLCLQIAGVYGLELDFMDRIRELWPVIGSGLGMRQLSRAAVGLIPGAGPAIKASIAFTGTYTMGEAVRFFYENGRRVNVEGAREFALAARKEALRMAQRVVDSLKGRGDPE